MSTVRDRTKPIKIYVSLAERHALVTRANACSLPVSAYLRALGTGYQPKSTLDADAILKLVKLHADQGRLGGLLKLWLSEKPGQGAAAFDVRQVLRQIEALQGELKALVARLK